MIKYPFSKRVDILGMKYTIEVKDQRTDPLFQHSSAEGYMDWTKKRIVIRGRNVKDIKNQESHIIWARKTLRHEIVHAFFTESGLQHNTQYRGNWADNEEMVDWFAIMGPRIIKAWQDSGAIE